MCLHIRFPATDAVLGRLWNLTQASIFVTLWYNTAIYKCVEIHRWMSDIPVRGEIWLIEADHQGFMGYSLPLL